MLILQIFAQRARSHEGKLQVELARLQYVSTRLVRRWSHLERQRGGIGNRGGPGETQIELDRRMIGESIKRTKERLDKVKKQRNTQRRQRERNQVFNVSLVGYTNAGKSTLLNTLTDAGVLQEDKLFATLDPTTRRTALGGGLEILLTDTVGFIQKLPHHLIDAFRSTLEEARFSDFLVHVVDASHQDWDVQRLTTLEVLTSLGCGDKPQVLVFNKMDALAENEVLRRGLELQFPEAVFVSLRTGDGLDALKKKLSETLKTLRRPVLYRLPLNRGDLLGYLYKHTQVLSEAYTETAIDVLAVAPPSAAAALLEFAT